MAGFFDSYLNYSKLNSQDILFQVPGNKIYKQ